MQFLWRKNPQYHAALESASLKVLDGLLSSAPRKTDGDKEWDRGFKWHFLPPMPGSSSFEGFPPDPGKMIEVPLDTRRAIHYWSLVADNLALSRDEIATMKDIPGIITRALRETAFDDDALREFDIAGGLRKQMECREKPGKMENAQGKYSFTQPFQTSHDPEIFTGLLKKYAEETREAIHRLCSPRERAGTAAGIGYAR